MDRHKVEQAVLSTLREGESVLCTLSGGADSVALLSAIANCGYHCRAVHCNYHLRGEESNRDETHARQIAKSLGVAIDVIDCDVQAYRESHPNTSVEMACREIRYALFDELKSRYRLDSIALGHHLEDNIETLMINMLRGSGIKGLAAMQRRRGIFLRPFLNLTRADILDYLEDKKLKYIVDSSNLSTDYRRNVIRNLVMPLLSEHFPTAVPGLAHTIDSLANQRTLLENLVKEMSLKFVNPDGSIDIRGIKTTGYNSEALLFEILNNPVYRGMNIEMCRSIIDNSDNSGKHYLATDGTEYILQYGRLYAVMQADDAVEQCINLLSPGEIEWGSKKLKWDFLKPEDFQPQRNPDVAYFDTGKLANLGPVSIRSPRAGDRIMPWGMKGSKLLSDIFTDLHLPRGQRMTTPVLTAGKHILWVVGIRASRIASVDSSTNSIVRVCQIINDR